MHALHFNYSYSIEFAEPDDLIERYGLLHDSCVAARQAGVDQVSVVQRFCTSTELVRDGIRYHFINDGFGPVLKWWQRPKAMNSLASRLSPDVIHLHGVAHFAGSLRSSVGPARAIVWQNRTPGNPSRRSQWLWRRALRSIDSALFTSVDQSKGWLKLGLITPRQEIHEVLGGSTQFEPLPYGASRAQVGMRSGPIFLWVGRLNANKDPLTVVAGFREILKTWEHTRLYMIFGTDDLLSDVKRMISRLSLDGRIHLLGKIDHKLLPLYYSAADYFVVGSHEEDCGLAVMEAIACGATPVITNIPSFRRLTYGGQVGALWQPGSAQEFAHAAGKVRRRSLTRAQIRAHFMDNLSYGVMGKELLHAYSHAIAKAGERRLSG